MFSELTSTIISRRAPSLSTQGDRSRPPSPTRSPPSHQCVRLTSRFSRSVSRWSPLRLFLFFSVSFYFFVCVKFVCLSCCLSSSESEVGQSLWVSVLASLSVHNTASFTGCVGLSLCQLSIYLMSASTCVGESVSLPPFQGPIKWFQRNQRCPSRYTPLFSPSQLSVVY